MNAGGRENTRSASAQSAVPVGLVVGADERRQFRLGQHPVLHLPRDGDGAVRPHEPGQRRVEISSPIVEGFAPPPESAGKLGVAEPVDTWVTQPRDAQRLGRVRALRPAGEFPKQQEFREPGPVGEELFVARRPNALDPLIDLDPPGQPVHQLGPCDAVGVA